MPPDSKFTRDIEFIYARNLKAARRKRLRWTLAWLIIPPAATLAGIVIGYYSITHRLIGF